MKRYALFLLIAAVVSAGLWSCEPEKCPGDGPIEKPDPTPDPAPEPEGTVIYYDNLDKEKSTANNNYFDTWTACRNMEGTGTADVTYDGSYTSVRSNWVSTGYPGASGLNGVYYSQNGGKSLIQVKNITLPSDVRTYRLSIGLHNPVTGNSVVSGQTFVIGIADGDSLSPEEYKELPFNVRMYGKWAYATAVFEIASAATEHISIRVKSLVATTRSDDLKLMTTTETPEHSFSFNHAGDPVVTRDYVEWPLTLNENSDWKYVSHRGKTYTSNKDVRNYEACYDISRHNPMWVAFPCHAIWQEGGSVRPDPDPFRPDPDIPEAEQSRIYADDWNNWPNNTSYFWSGLPDGTFTTRGHLLGSADRGAGRKDRLFDLNVQTFYATNVAPEAYLNDLGDDYTTSHWGLVERLRQDRWTCSDTLYVVIGCDYKEGWTVNDNVRGKNVYDGSKVCAMPSARYLIALRTKKGNSGKPIWECSADEVMAIGFWFPQRFHEAKITELPPLADYTYSVSEIERMTGGDFRFFPLAPAEVKDSYSISDWPGLSAIAGTPTRTDGGLTTEDFTSAGPVSW